MKNTFGLTSKEIFMKKPIYIIIVLSLFFCCWKTTLYATQSQKFYISYPNIVFESTNIYVQVKDEWFKTNALKSDEQGFYVSQKDIVSCGARISSVPKKWQCPYCYHWWNIGEKCQNKDCPTNNW